MNKTQVAFVLDVSALLKRFSTTVSQHFIVPFLSALEEPEKPVEYTFVYFRDNRPWADFSVRVGVWNQDCKYSSIQAAVEQFDFRGGGATENCVGEAIATALEVLPSTTSNRHIVLLTNSLPHKAATIFFDGKYYDYLGIGDEMLKRNVKFSVVSWKNGRELRDLFTRSTGQPAEPTITIYGTGNQDHLIIPYPVNTSISSPEIMRHAIVLLHGIDVKKFSEKVGGISISPPTSSMPGAITGNMVNPSQPTNIPLGANSMPVPVNPALTQVPANTNVGIPGNTSAGTKRPLGNPASGQPPLKIARTGPPGSVANPDMGLTGIPDGGQNFSVGPNSSNVPTNSASGSTNTNSTGNSTGTVPLPYPIPMSAPLRSATLQSHNAQLENVRKGALNMPPVGNVNSAAPSANLVSQVPISGTNTISSVSPYGGVNPNSMSQLQPGTGAQSATPITNLQIPVQLGEILWAGNIKLNNYQGQIQIRAQNPLKSRQQYGVLEFPQELSMKPVKVKQQINYYLHCGQFPIVEVSFLSGYPDGGTDPHTLYCMDQAVAKKLCIIPNSGNTWQGFIHPGQNSQNTQPSQPVAIQSAIVSQGGMPASSISLPQNSSNPAPTLSQNTIPTGLPMPQGTLTSPSGTMTVPLGSIPMSQGQMSMPPGQLAIPISSQDGSEIIQQQMADQIANSSAGGSLMSPVRLVQLPQMGNVNLGGISMNVGNPNAIPLNATASGNVNNPVLVGIPQHAGTVSFTSNQFKTSQLLQPMKL